MQFPDRQRAVDLGTGTFSFTGMMTDPTADSWERVLIFEEL
jgi:hypothetical protein